jgi:hypothetical protein
MDAIAEGASRMKKIGVIVFALLLGAYADIVNDAGTQFYYTAGIPGKDSSATEVAGTQFYFTAGVLGGDSVGTAGCDSNITNTPVAVDTQATTFSVSCSVLCGAGKLYLYSSAGAKVDSNISITSGTRDTLTITGGTPSQDDSVRFIFSDTVNSVGDTSAWLAYTYADTADTSDPWTPTGASITGEPSNDTCYIGQTGSFTITASDYDSLRWQKYITDTWTDIASATALTYTTAATVYADNGSEYRVIAYGAGGDDTSAVCTLTVFAAYIQSISPSKGKRLSSVAFYADTLMDSTAGVRATLNSVYLTVTKWSEDTVKGTIPAWAPRGYYWPILAHIAAGDTTILDTASTRFRVMVPEILTGGP